MMCEGDNILSHPFKFISRKVAQIASDSINQPRTRKKNKKTNKQILGKKTSSSPLLAKDYVYAFPYISIDTSTQTECIAYMFSETQQSQPLKGLSLPIINTYKSKPQVSICAYAHIATFPNI